ncbi:MAG: hypothetical protein OHK0029_28220 [Armatimonadaceae bacterium]
MLIYLPYVQQKETSVVEQDRSGPYRKPEMATEQCCSEGKLKNSENHGLEAKGEAK